MKRDSAIKLTQADKIAAKAAILDINQGMVRDDGSL
jgi:hypothetical protein